MNKKGPWYTQFKIIHGSVYVLCMCFLLNLWWWSWGPMRPGIGPVHDSLKGWDRKLVSYPHVCHRDWYPRAHPSMFSSGRFMVSGLTFKSLIHSKLMSVYVVRYGPGVLLLHVASQFSYIYWRDGPFAIICSWHLCWHCCCLFPL